MCTFHNELEAHWDHPCKREATSIKKQSKQVLVGYAPCSFRLLVSLWARLLCAYLLGCVGGVYFCGECCVHVCGVVWSCVCVCVMRSWEAAVCVCVFLVTWDVV